MEETRIIEGNQPVDQPDQGLSAGVELLDGKFKIDRKIGAGGFGITYLAHDTFLERAIVIKECFPQLICMRVDNNVAVNASTHEEQYRNTIDMFMREARSLARLRHPNIVSVHQAFEENGTAYMVLDLFEGLDLLDMIEDHPEALTPSKIRDILLKVLDAIDLVHSNDLLHRDISPDNILLDKSGTPALIDFGAARQDASQKNNEISKILVVKDGYSPHEFYVRGGIQAPSSDLYALAATMYHVITGKAPPDSQSRVCNVADHNEDLYVPLAGNHPQYAPAFLKAIDKAMSIPPKDRIQTAKEWLALITEEKVQPRKAKQSGDKKLTKAISELIERTSLDEAPAIPLRQPVAVPKAVSAPEVKPYRPSWVEEFNRETVEVAELKRREAERAAAEEAERRAEEARLAKQERLAQAAALEAERQKKLEEEERASGIIGWVKGAKSS